MYFNFIIDTLKEYIIGIEVEVRGTPRDRIGYLKKGLVVNLYSKNYESLFIELEQS